MATALINFVSQSLSLSWLTGPIFDKELRVSSRRRRNYVLRFAYLVLLTIFLVLVWVEEVRFSGSAAYWASRMARAGQTIIMTIILFQFYATQLIAIIMLSTSISDEIYNRTLGVLMTTPINSFQIVMGKLFSKLLQLILLMAISLPLLAIVRVFGGVPWGYVISSLCITLTAVIFVGSVSLFFSIFSRKAYVVIIMTILTLTAFFALLPFLTAVVLQADIERTFTTTFIYVNPSAVLAFSTDEMMSPRGGAGISIFSCLLHCGIMLAASAFVLSVSIRLVRKVALRQAASQLKPFTNWLNSKNNSPESTARQKPTGRIRRVNGPPIVWKELISPMYRRHRLAALTVIAIELILLVITFFFPAVMSMFGYQDTLVLYVLIFMALAMLFTIIFPATCITSEKEARSWPLLLATTLSDWQILFGKLVGVLRRCLPVWLLLLAYVIAFSYAEILHPIAIIQIAVLIAWIFVFLSGTGLYFSARLKHTTSAVVANLTLALVLWAFIPILLGLVSQIPHCSDHAFMNCISANPLIQAVVIINGTGSLYTAQTGLSGLVYSWPHGSYRIGPTTTVLLTTMLFYFFAGFLFAWRAKRRFRRNIF